MMIIDPLFFCGTYKAVIVTRLQNPEEAVTFDTVPNVKKQHEVNVGECLAGISV